MIEEQKIVEVQGFQLVEEARKMKDGGYRLVQIGATAVQEGYELNYSFDKEYKFVNLRLRLESNTVEVPSVSQVYWNAFLYENEIHDLYGITFDGLVLDFKGHFYLTSIPTPFAASAPTPGVSTSVIQPRA